MRQADIERSTAETNISLRLNLDGSGQYEISSGIGFLDHMLGLLARHALIDLKLACQGDRVVDDHHSVEDIGICLGQALRQALHDKAGIARYGETLLPMDEALIACALDLSGRGGYYGDLRLPTEKIGSFDSELVAEFFTAFCREGGVCLHIRQLAGSNSHHIAEAAFKGCARALRQAIALDPGQQGRVNSSKGSL